MLQDSNQIAHAAVGHFGYSLQYYTISTCANPSSQMMKNWLIKTNNKLRPNVYAGGTSIATLNRPSTWFQFLVDVSISWKSQAELLDAFVQVSSSAFCYTPLKLIGLSFS